MINNLNILCGDSLQVLKTLPANSINCCVTSPPYYNLRDYGQDGQIGQEKTPEEFVQKLVELFREVRRVLTDDGTLWLNLGDSYAGSMKGSNGDGTWNDRTGTKQGTNHGALGVKPTKAKDIGLKPKDLIGIPWMVAQALRDPYYTGVVKNELDRVWLAAMMDAEGSICGTEYINNDRPKTNIYITITNTSLNIINKCDNLFPQEIKHVYEKTNNSSNRPCFRWDVEQMDKKSLFIREIYPHLVAKRKQAILAYTFIEMQRGLVSKKKGYLKDQQEQRSWIMQSLSLLNNGVDVELPNWVIEPPSLFEEGFYLRQDIIWCLSGGTWVYTRSQKGDMPMMIKDLYRLDPSTIQLWNGKKWTQLLGISKSERKGTEIELILRSGERISSSSNHQFPTNRGLLKSSEMQEGDILENTILPEPEDVLDSIHINSDIAWFAGLYIAEGSRSEDTIQIAGHIKEEERWKKISQIAKEYGGSATRTIDGNKMDIRVYGKVLNSIIDYLVSGRNAHNKCLNPVCWRYSNTFLLSLLKGYLSGDGHYDGDNDRWVLGFCRNYNLERDLRILSARFGFSLILNPSFSVLNGKKFPSFRGELRMTRSGHFNEKNRNEVVEIRKSRCRFVYDLGVEDEPHLFSLASGVLTHNCKPNPMPESVTDRCTKAHEYLFLLTKSKKYHFDNEAIKVPSKQDWGTRDRTKGKYHNEGSGLQPHTGLTKSYPMANKRSVWSITAKPFKGAHFATFPPELVEPCIKAGCPVDGTVLDPFGGSGTTGMVALQLGRKAVLIELNPEYIPLIEQRCGGVQSLLPLVEDTTTLSQSVSG